jgi:hypothetical protein
MSFDVGALVSPTAGSVVAGVVNGPGLIDGTAKLVQRFLLELLTPAGSILYQPARGSSFTTDLQGMRFATELDLRVSLARALVQVRANLQGEDSAADPAGERYQGALLTKLTLVSGAAIMTIVVRSMASVDSVLSVAVELSW